MRFQNPPYNLAENYRDFLDRKFKGVVQSNDSRVSVSSGLDLKLTNVSETPDGYTFHGELKGIEVTFAFQEKVGKLSHMSEIIVPEERIEQVHRKIVSTIPVGQITRILKDVTFNPYDALSSGDYKIKCKIARSLGNISDLNEISVEIFNYLFKRPFGIATGLV